MIMNKLHVYQVDAFTDEVFKGNPAAVIPLRDWLPDRLMQQIAMENNLSETVFFVPLSPEQMKLTGADYHIRWFTPELEIDLCGHATLATAMVIDQILDLDTTFKKISFITEKAGLLPVGVENQNYTLDFPSRPPESCPTPEGLAEALGTEAIVQVLRSRDYFIVLKDEQTVRELKPDFAALAKLDGVGVIVTAQGSDCDAVSRCFFPKAGVPEDPVTGSAHCNIIPYWSERLGKDDLQCKQVSARGGTLLCKNKGDRVLMTGKCVLFMEGVIHLPLAH
jgi:PhzF family phenazine biosynthesis protein